MKNPVYYGVFRYGGEYYEGIHPPIITKQLFDKVQETSNRRHRATRKKKYEFAFRGFIKCGECGAMITAEIKKGKYRYYHCTKRKGRCSQPFNTTEENLSGQLSSSLSKIWLNDKTTNKIINDFENYREKEDKNISGQVGKLEHELKNTEQKLDRLLDGYINGLISAEEFQSKKQKLVERKIEIKEKLEGFSDKRTGWFELASDIINSCNSIKNAVEKNDYLEIVEIAQKTGSNFELRDKTLTFSFQEPFDFIFHSGEQAFKNFFSPQDFKSFSSPSGPTGPVQASSVLLPSVPISSGPGMGDFLDFPFFCSQPATSEKKLSFFFEKDVICIKWRRGRDSNSRYP